jgi:hypothetical protein
MVKKKNLYLCAPLAFGIFTRRSLVAARKNCVLQNPSKFNIVSLILFGLFAGVFVLFCFFVRDFDFQLHSGVCGVLSALSLSLSPVSFSLWCFFSLWMFQWHLRFCQLLLFDPFWIEILARKSFCWSCKLLACS